MHSLKFRPPACIETSAFRRSDFRPATGPSLAHDNAPNELSCATGVRSQRLVARAMVGSTPWYRFSDRDAW